MNLLSSEKVSTLIRKYFVLVILLFSTINVKLPMFTFIANSGYIYIYASEIIMFLIILFFVYNVVRKKYILNSDEKKIFHLIILFLIIYVVLTIFRYFLNYNFKDSIFALKISIFPIFLFYMPRFLNIRKEDIITNLVIFHFILNCFQFLYFENIRASVFLENIMIYLTVSISLICIDIYSLFNMKKGRFLYCKYSIVIFNIVFSVICVFFAGSRISMFVLILLTMAIIVYYLFVNLKYATIIFCLFTASFILSVAIPIYNKNVISNLNRVIDFNNIFNNSKSDYSNEIDTDIKKAEDSPLDGNDILITDGNYSDIHFDNDFTINERIKSDNIRKYLISRAVDNIKRSYIIGYGTYTFEYNDGGGVKYQSAHNFILEYLCLYGPIGTVVYFLLVFDLLKKYLFYKFDYSKYFILISTISVLIHSLVQPTMLSVVVVYTFWFLLSISVYSGDTLS